MNEIAAILRDCAGIPLEIQGHTDSQGREEMNQQLSQARAQSVLNALRARRVLVGGFEANGYGEATPIADNETEEGREANRRIEFHLIEAAVEPNAEEDAERQDQVSEAGTAAEQTDEAPPAEETIAKAESTPDNASDTPAPSDNSAEEQAEGQAQASATDGTESGTENGPETNADANTDPDSGSDAGSNVDVDITTEDPTE